MFEEEGTLYIEDHDQCLTCVHFNQGVQCPLLEGIYSGVVSMMPEGFAVKNCGFYEKYERILKVVPKTEEKS